MIFMCVMDYSANKQKLARVRPVHRVYMLDLISKGKAISAGSFVPDDDGGLFIYEAASLEEAKKLVEEDPYILEGVVDSYKLREYEVHGENKSLLRVTG